MPQKQPQLFISELFPSEDLRAFCRETGAGLETILFSMNMLLDGEEELLASFREQWPEFAGATCSSAAWPDVNAAGSAVTGTNSAGNTVAGANAAEISCLSVHGPFLNMDPSTWDPGIWEVTMRRFLQSYACAWAAGATRVVYQSGFYPNANYLEGWAERAAAFFADMLAICDKAGRPEDLFGISVQPDPKLFSLDGAELSDAGGLAGAAGMDAAEEQPECSAPDGEAGETVCGEGAAPLQKHCAKDGSAGDAGPEAEAGKTAGRQPHALCENDRKRRRADRLEQKRRGN